MNIVGKKRIYISESHIPIYIFRHIILMILDCKLNILNKKKRKVKKKQKLAKKLNALFPKILKYNIIQNITKNTKLNLENYPSKSQKSTRTHNNSHSSKAI